jgi:hypothetical protein
LEAGFMTRLRTDALPPPRDADCIIGMICGPATLSKKQLAAAWRVYGPELMRNWDHPLPGVRPWAWWRFSAGVEEPDDPAERIRIIEERGELRPGELQAFRERARADAVAWRITGPWPSYLLSPPLAVAVPCAAARCAARLRSS